MGNDVMLGAYSVPVILTVILGAIYKALPQVPDRYKPLIAAAVGVGLGIGAMFYNVEGSLTVANWIDYILYGFMVGASAVGLWEMSKKMTTACICMNEKLKFKETHKRHTKYRR